MFYFEITQQQKFEVRTLHGTVWGPYVTWHCCHDFWIFR